MTEARPNLLKRMLAGARTRVLLAFVVLLAFSTALSVLAIRQLLLGRTSDRVDAALTQEVEEFRALVRGSNPETGEPFRGDLEAIFDTYLRRNVPASGETVVVTLGGRVYDRRSSDSGGTPLLRELERRWVSLRGTERGDVETSIGTVRYLAVPVRGSRIDGAFVVMSALEGERDEVEDAVRLAALVLLTVLVIASALAWLVAGRVLAPLQQLHATARSISETDLTRRIPASGSDEIAELARTFNAMLDRLEGAFATQRDFVSDASHELRTPITIVRGHLELLSDDPVERRETIALVTDELDRMSRAVEDMLTLAKAERDDFLRPDALELGALTDEVLDKVRGLAERDWRLESRGEALLHADRQRLTQVVVALASNAMQHTADGDPIWLGSSAGAGEARLWVRDSGPGVEPADQQRIFERFARAQAGRRRSEGAGLGLAIVKAIAEAHGGRVELASRPGEGATFTVVIPTSPQGVEVPEEPWVAS